MNCNLLMYFSCFMLSSLPLFSSIFSCSRCHSSFSFSVVVKIVLVLLDHVVVDIVAELDCCGVFFLVIDVVVALFSVEVVVDALLPIVLLDAEHEVDDEL